MKTPAVRSSALALLALGIGVAAGAADPISAPPDPGEPITARSEAAPMCIRLNRIRSTEVIDRKHILFKLSNGEMYVNKLPNACVGLSRNGIWVNRTPANEICDLGLIVPLVKTFGTFQTFGYCSLGKFEWVAPPAVEALRAELNEQKDGEAAPNDGQLIEEPAPSAEPASPEAEPGEQE